MTLVLFTDFGLEGPWVGQMKAVLAREAPGVTVLDMMHDAPAFDPRAGAVLLAALVPRYPADSVFLCVVDPGVGGDRRPLIVEAGGQTFVGPDNGLLALAVGRAGAAGNTSQPRWREILWRPGDLSASFHGRDLFAPVAGRIAAGGAVETRDIEPGAGADWPPDLASVVYIDRFGNAMTGLGAGTPGPRARLRVGSHEFARRRSFSDVPAGQALWYENSLGLAEIAVNGGRADSLEGIARGAAVTVVDG